MTIASLLINRFYVITGVKRLGHEADHSPPSSTEVKECAKLYLHSPNTPSWRDAWVKKHRDNFTFTFYHGKNSTETLKQ